MQKRPGRIKFKDGQRSLLPDVPTVRYCRRCGRLLTTPKALAAGIGKRCQIQEFKQA